MSSCVRVVLKKSHDNLPRPTKFTLKNSDHVSQVLRNAPRLYTKDGYKAVYICPDRTGEEPRTRSKLFEQLNKKRKSEPHKVHVINLNRVLPYTPTSL